MKAGFIRRIRDWYHFNQIFMVSKMVVSKEIFLELLVNALWELLTGAEEGSLSGMAKFSIFLIKW